MALDKVKQGVIADDAVGSSQIAPDTVVAADIGANAVGTSELADNVTVGGTSHLGIPAGTTAQRPGSPSAGNTRFNSTTGSLEFYDGSGRVFPRSAANPSTWRGMHSPLDIKWR